MCEPDWTSCAQKGRPRWMCDPHTRSAGLPGERGDTPRSRCLPKTSSHPPRPPVYGVAMEVLGHVEPEVNPPGRTAIAVTHSGSKTGRFWLCNAENRLLAPQLAPVSREIDGRGGIRTPEAGVTRLLVFKTSAFNRSATLPSAAHGKASRSASRQWERSGDHPAAGHGGGPFDLPSSARRPRGARGPSSAAAAGNRVWRGADLSERAAAGIIGEEWLQAAVASLGRPGRRLRPANENKQTPRVVSASIRRVQSR